jgi:hypothetical protein
MIAAILMELLISGDVWPYAWVICVIMFVRGFLGIVRIIPRVTRPGSLTADSTGVTEDVWGRKRHMCWSNIADIHTTTARIHELLSFDEWPMKVAVELTANGRHRTTGVGVFDFVFFGKSSELALMLDDPVRVAKTLESLRRRHLKVGDGLPAGNAAQAATTRGKTRSPLTLMCGEIVAFAFVVVAYLALSRGL